jgi:hypothetical protein
MLGVSEKQAENVSKEWYNLKAQRQDIRKGCEISMSKLREQVAEAVQAKRARKAKTRTNQKYLKMSRKQLGELIKTRGGRADKGCCNSCSLINSNWPWSAVMLGE